MAKVESSGGIREENLESKKEGSEDKEMKEKTEKIKDVITAKEIFLQLSEKMKEVYAANK